MVMHRSVMPPMVMMPPMVNRMMVLRHRKPRHGEKYEPDQQ
jgi:hypothetical protein